jgi:hypothetical protein
MATTAERFIYLRFFLRRILALRRSERRVNVENNGLRFLAMLATIS